MAPVETPTMQDLGFSAATIDWFTSTFDSPTNAQLGAWGPISQKQHTLLSAPTGSGKTLAAFLWTIDKLSQEPRVGEGVRCLYISPLRALAVDVERNLASPIRGVALSADRLGVSVREPTVGIRTGDTTPKERRRLVTDPPEILITTPESLYLLLTSKARETLATVETVIIDEIHAVAGTKRGAHLSVSLERLEHYIANTATDHTPMVHRIGLSATQRPIERIGRFLGGFTGVGDQREPRPVSIVDGGASKELDLEIIVPVEDMSALGKRTAQPIPVLDEQTDDPFGALPKTEELELPTIWTAVHPAILDLIHQHRSTLVFVNARRSAERLAHSLNDVDRDRARAESAIDDYDTNSTGTSDNNGDSTSHERDTLTSGEPPVEELVKAHHGSLSKERRAIVEDELKAGTLRGLVATSSLELGIDMGAIDLVVQVESPGSVASGMQRIGRAGHQVGVPSVGKIFPKHRADLLEATVVVQRMKQGLIESTSIPQNPLDVLAQQIVAACAVDDWELEALYELFCQSASFMTLSMEQFTNTVDMLAGRYPAEEFAGLIPRIVWDRTTNTLTGRSGAQRVAVVSGGTIPDRGLFGVFLPDGTRVGELDEEMVYESRVGEVFLLGASSWKIQEITHERVVVLPAPGQPGRMPFWRGEGPGREAELGAAVGEFVRNLSAMERDAAVRFLEEECSLDPLAAENLTKYLSDQMESTSVLPDDRTIVIERFRDEIGDWRVCIHTPFGARVHAPWAMLIRDRLTEYFSGNDMVGWHPGLSWDPANPMQLVETDGSTGADPHNTVGMAGSAPVADSVEALWSDDGIVLRLPEAAESIPTELLIPDRYTVEDELIRVLPSSSLFAARFREVSARALLLPRARPGQRSPLWQQRQRAADLLAVASKYPAFPMLLETVRECCHEVFDLPAFNKLLEQVENRSIRIVEVETPSPSPYAQSLLFAWIAVFMYEGDTPLAERRAAALALDRELLGDLLGAEEYRSLFEESVLEQLELELAREASGFQARNIDELHDIFRVLGPLTADALTPKVIESERARIPSWLSELEARRRVIAGRLAGREVWYAAEDAARMRDGFGLVIPYGIPETFLTAVPNPVRDLVLRHLRTHGPVRAVDIAERFGLHPDAVTLTLEEMVATQAVHKGEFRPGGSGTEYCEQRVFAQLKRRSLAALRDEAAPVEPQSLVRFLASWQGVGAQRRGVDGVLTSLETLQGAPLGASIFEQDILSVRMLDYSPAFLDELCMSGELIWVGDGAVGSQDGRIKLLFRDDAPYFLDPISAEQIPNGPYHTALMDHLTSNGASFWADLIGAVQTVGLRADPQTVLLALWDLVWAGVVTNDSLTPLRAYTNGGAQRQKRAKNPGRRGAVSRGRRRGFGQVGAAATTGLGGPTSGRWSLTSSLRFDVNETEVLAARAMQLLNRYGVLTREMALGEGNTGGFAGVYPMLKAFEERGDIRRGYFVAGLGAAQFARAGAVDRLRSQDVDQAHDTTTPVGQPQRLTSVNASTWVAAATDPAQPFGGVIPWPESVGSPSRSLGALVVLVHGEACAYLDRSGKKILTFPAAENHVEWPAMLTELVTARRRARLVISEIDEQPASQSPWATALYGAGFQTGYKGLTYG